MLLQFFPTFVVKNRFDSCSVCTLLYYSQNTIICSAFIPVTTSKKLLIWMFVDQSSLIWPFNPIFTQCLIFVWSSVFSLNQCEPNIFVIHSNSPQCDTSYVFICLKTLINKLPSVWSYNDTCSFWLLCWNLWESWGVVRGIVGGVAFLCGDKMSSTLGGIIWELKGIVCRWQQRPLQNTRAGFEPAHSQPLRKPVFLLIGWCLAFVESRLSLASPLAYSQAVATLFICVCLLHPFARHSTLAKQNLLSDLRLHY